MALILHPVPCTAVNSGDFADEYDYFASTLSLDSNHNLLSALSAAGITPSNTKKYTGDPLPFSFSFLFSTDPKTGIGIGVRQLLRHNADVSVMCHSYVTSAADGPTLCPTAQQHVLDLVPVRLLRFYSCCRATVDEYADSLFQQLQVLRLMQP